MRRDKTTTGRFGGRCLRAASNNAAAGRASHQRSLNNGVNMKKQKMIFEQVVNLEEEIESGRANPTDQWAEPDAMGDVEAYVAAPQGDLLGEDDELCYPRTDQGLAAARAYLGL